MSEDLGAWTVACGHAWADFCFRGQKNGEPEMGPKQAGANARNQTSRGGTVERIVRSR